MKTMVKARIPLCAREVRKRCEELACPAEDDAQHDEFVVEPLDERVDEPVDEWRDEQVELQEEEQPEQDLHAAEIMLRRVHANLGHPSKGLMLRLLRDANAPLEMLPEILIVSADLMTRRTRAVRPVLVSRSKEPGHTNSIDACHWKRNCVGREAIIVNIIGEASRFHVALVFKEGEPSELGNLTAMDYIEAVRKNWFRFARAPAVIRVDSEGAFKSTSFECGAPLEALKFKWWLVKHIGKLELFRPTFDF